VAAVAGSYTGQFLVDLVEPEVKVRRTAAARKRTAAAA
jgi:hypothetical protein